MPKKPETPPLLGDPAPLRAPQLVKPAATQADPRSHDSRSPDPRNGGRPNPRGRPAGGRPPRFPGRTGGR